MLKKLFINSTFSEYHSKCDLPVYKCILLAYISEAFSNTTFLYTKPLVIVYTLDKTHSFTCK